MAPIFQITLGSLDSLLWIIVLEKPIEIKAWSDDDKGDTKSSPLKD